MKQLLIVSAIVVWGNTLAAAEPMSLREAYELALATSEQWKIADAELRAAEAQYRQATGAFWPEVNAGAVADFQDDRSDAGRSDEYRAGVGATWTLFNGFRTLRDADARRAEGEAVAFARERFRELLYLDVADVFYLVAAYEREVEVLNATLTAFEERVKELESRVALGRSRKADLLASRVQWADARVDLARVAGLRDAARELLAFLVGRPASEWTPVVEGELPRSVESPGADGAQTRADLLAQEKRVEAAEMDLKAEQGDRNATVEADGNYYVWRDPDDQGEWDLTIRAEIPVFDGGRRRGAIGEQVAAYEIQELRLAELRRIADREVRVATRHFEGLLEQWMALQQALDVSRENLEVQRSDYEIGRSSNLDVLSALVQDYALKRREAALEMQVRAGLVRVQVARGGGIEP